ncbi:hypothetical protein P0082_12185 [Candidatus Haliotispira prima]|uniref:Alginate export domain-containing protein n=1 Tax=Candidatus Haliotispira prima TaxID=3034016 RepID=A0ABY8MJ40_9SPIO|nr:hypothetical protein P0082_12185 [Candidatus Haliotispira prima]
MNGNMHGLFRTFVAVLLLSILGSFYTVAAQTITQEEEDPFAAIPDLGFADETLSVGEDEDLPGSESGDGSSVAPEDEVSSLWRSEAKLNSHLSAEGKIYRDGIEQVRSNPDNRLHLRALGLLMDFDLEADLTLLRPRDDANAIERKRLSLVMNFFGRADNENAGNPHSTQQSGSSNPGDTVTPELARFSFGFRQLYFRYFASLQGSGGASDGDGSGGGGPELELSIGKQPYSQGVSLYFNPANYLDDSGSFFRIKNNWQVLFGLSWSVFALRLRYMPVIRFHSDSDLQANILRATTDDYGSWEYAFSFLESQNRRQLLGLEASLFLGQSNWQLFGYAMEKSRYDWSNGFYLALGAGGRVPFVLGRQHFQLYGEGLLGNGLNKLGRLKASGLEAFPVAGLGQPPRYLWANADLDEVRFRGLVGLQWTPLANFDVYFEYRYDGSALESEQLQRLLGGLEDYNEFSGADSRQGLFWQGLTDRNVFAAPFALTRHVLALAFTWRNIADHLDIQSSYFLALPDGSSTLQFRANVYLLNDSLQLYCQNDWYLPAFFSSDYRYTGAFGMVPYLSSVELGLEIQY